MDLSIIIPVYNQISHTINCLNGVIFTCGFDSFEVIVVNDGSTDNTSYVVSKLFPGVNIIENSENCGFATTVNNGMKASVGKKIILLNNDVTIHDPMWAKKMSDKMVKYGADLVAPAGGRMNSKFEYVPGEAKREDQIFSFLVGWCLMFDRRVYDSIGGMPTIYNKGFFEDVHWYLRAKKKGFVGKIVEGINVKHLYHATFKAEKIDVFKQYTKNRGIFLKEAKKEGLI